MNPTLADLIEDQLTILRKRQGRSALKLLETGSIRSSNLRYRDGDGWSTVALATHTKIHGGSAESIDLSTRAAEAVLAAHGLTDSIHLTTGYSVERLVDHVAKGHMYDFILLDSDNNQHLCLHEYMVAERMIAKGGIIMIDDVEPGSGVVVKGNLVAPYLDVNKTEYEILTRSKAHVTTGVAVVNF